MCHPAVAIGFSALAAGAQYVGQQQQAKATYKYQLKRQQQTVAASADAARQQYHGSADRTSQARAAASVDVQNAMKQYRRASASGRVAAAGGGVMGESVEAAAGEFAQRFEDYHASRMQNLTWQEAQLLSTAQGIHAQHRGRVEGAGFAPVAMPSQLQLVASIGQGVMQAYSDFPNDPMWGPMRRAFGTEG
jgi:hypothetical protein